MTSPIDFERQNANEWDLETTNYRPPTSTFSELRVFFDAKPQPTLRAGPSAKGKPKALRTTSASRPHTPGPRKAQTRPGTHRIANRLPGERDNSAKAAWRNRSPPTGTYELPSGYDRIDTRLFRKDRAAKARGLERSPYLVLEQIGAQTGAYIEPPSNLSTRVLKIWGNEAQLQLATAALQNWVAHNQKRTHPEHERRWIKPNVEPSARKQAAIDRKMREEASKQSFRRNPEDTGILTAVGIFMCPSKEYDVRVILGQNLEALDQIRVDCKCYIVFEEELSVFKVLTNNAQSLGEALRRIRVVFCEIVARNTKPRRLYLIEPPTLGGLRTEVVLEDQNNLPQSEQPAGKSMNAPGVVPVAAGPKPTPEHISTWNGNRLELSSANQQSLKHAILKTLADLRFCRGHIQMRVHFGVPVLQVYKKPIGPRHTFEEFMAVLGMPQTRVEVAKCIGNNEWANSLTSRCCHSTGLFVPGDAMTHALEDIIPIISATFDFAGTERSGPIRLELDFKKVEDDEYEISAIRWLKDNAPGGRHADIFRGRKQRKVLDSITINLDKKPCWQLEVVTTTELEASKITQEMHDFVKLVKVDVSQTSTQQGKVKAHLKVRCPNFSRLGMRSFVQQSRFQYLLVGSDYVFEVTKYEHFSQESGEPVNSGVSRAAGSNLEKSATTISKNPDVRWGASFYSSQWDTILKEQVDIGTGNVGNWLPDLDAFFPRGRMSTTNSTTDTGFEEFTEKIDTMMKLLRSE
ncbi:hypothetical protein FGG08_000929 [Glutinoglossum americanum]|uniref:DUF7905 domain-containing protein n=1 Tax=Glutinoglossum americanum TaxID=1670608 RepID=A0A9P8IHL9_9PEZI|nr:hypothetical protein FGG08_000929 [Glutinoglossum americanum]